MAIVTAARVYKSGQSGEPPFPGDFDVVRRAVLQVTDIKSNHNKYYALELHAAKAPPKTPPKAPSKPGKNGHAHPTFRLFTHYGRTDDLDLNPDSGQKECRYFDSLEEAQAGYQSIYGEKTGPRKGYKEVSLASCRIGSLKARGTSSGEVDPKTVRKLAEAEEKKAAAAGKPAIDRPKPLDLHPSVADLVRYVFSEATSALTTTVAARITAQGIETPLGILTLGQVEKGEAILAKLHKLLLSGGASKSSKRRPKLEELSGEFYTVIPHRIGRSRNEIAAAVIDSIESFGQKQETLQLMKDMLQVNGDAGQTGRSVLYDAVIDQQYLSLKCDVGCLEKDTREYEQIRSHVVGGPRFSGAVKVRNIYTLRRAGEQEVFASDLDNQKLLFHGSRIQNWVGILSRGILLPKVAVNLGVRRTDAGWLGNGIYFGDVASTSCAYTSPGKRGTSLMALARVALGKTKKYTRITYGLTAPPDGFHSCHGVRGTMSDFSDDEFVVYDTRQQRLEYLVEFSH